MAAIDGVRMDRVGVERYVLRNIYNKLNQELDRVSGLISSQECGKRVGSGLEG